VHDYFPAADKVRQNHMRKYLINPDSEHRLPNGEPYVRRVNPLSGILSAPTVDVDLRERPRPGLFPDMVEGVRFAYRVTRL
jgi:hypothetical protein